MNLGTLSGFTTEGLNIVGTQYFSTYSQLTYNNSPHGFFHAPREATHALISACAAGGGSGTALNTDGVDTYYGGYAGGGAGGACFRIPFDLSFYRYVPWTITHTVGVFIGSSVDGYDMIAPPKYAGMPAIKLSNGADSTMVDISFVDVGGNGGGVTYVDRQSSAATGMIVLNGGLGSDPDLGQTPQDGRVVSIKQGLLASGGGGGSSGSPRAGSVCAPWGTMLGGSNQSGFGGGGASLFAPGITGYFDISSFRIYTTGQAIGNKFYETVANGRVIYGIPGAGLCGGGQVINDSGYYGNWRSMPFIYCEFVTM